MLRSVAILVLVCVLQASQLELNKLRITSIKCVGNDVFFYDIQCSLKPVRKLGNLLVVNLNLRKPLDNVMVHAQLFKRSSSAYHPFMANVTFNLCKALEKPTRTKPIERVSLEFLTYHINISSGCPLEGQIVSYPKPTLAMIPSVVVSGIYRLHYNFTENNMWISLVTIQGLINSTLIF